MERADYPFKELGPRRGPDLDDVRAFARQGVRHDGRRSIPTAARSFQQRAAAEVAHYPETPALPKWILALVEKKVSVDEFARAVHDRTLRAPSEENQRLALLLANELARMPNGSKTVERYLTPDLLLRLSGGGVQR